VIQPDLVKSLGLRVTERLYAEIKDRANAEHRSMANWVVVAIEEKLARERPVREQRPEE
jgi:predicted HicB family RNase H-like nuclease